MRLSRFARNDGLVVIARNEAISWNCDNQLIHFSTAILIESIPLYLLLFYPV